MWDAMPDVALKINVFDYSPASENEEVSKWEMVSGLDFNSLMRPDDTSATDLVEELFFD